MDDTRYADEEDCFGYVLGWCVLNRAVADVLTGNLRDKEAALGWICSPPGSADQHPGKFGFEELCDTHCYSSRGIKKMLRWALTQEHPVMLRSAWKDAVGSLQVAYNHRGVL